MATQSLNPNATAFHPSFNWTVMNRPRFNSLCRYHSHDSGNRCHFGNACWYVHAQELHRPTLAEQTASLLCAVHAILSFAVSLLAQHTATTAVSGFADEQKTDDAVKTDCDEPQQPKSARAHSQDAAPHSAHDDARAVSEKMTTMVSNDHIDQKDEKVDDHIAGLPFEDHIEAKVDLDDETLDSDETEKLWRFVLANCPDKLVNKYPKLLNNFRQQQYFDNMDAVLTGLKKDNLNGKPVIIKGRVQSTQRFIVELHDYAKTPRRLLIKDENLLTLHPRPGCEASQLFKDEFGSDSWNQLTLNNCCLSNDKVLFCFIKHQFPHYDRTMATRRGHMHQMSSITNEAASLAKVRRLGVNRDDCSKILSLLYTLCFNRKLHVVRLFEIPSTWTPQKWDDRLEPTLFVLLPPND